MSNSNIYSPNWIGRLLTSLLALTLMMWTVDAWAGEDDGEEKPAEDEHSEDGGDGTDDGSGRRREEIVNWVKFANALKDACAGSSNSNACAKYCNGSNVNVCALTDSMLVAVALEIAHADMDELSELVITAAEADNARIDSDPFSIKVTNGFTDGYAASAFLAGAEPIEGSVTALLQRGLGALARVIADRAKREAIGWLLDDVASELCGDELEDTKQEIEDKKTEREALGDKDAARKVELNKDLARLDKKLARMDDDSLDKIARSELRNHWMPNLCALARENRLDHYGAGAALLEALQGALENDVLGWPGVLAGIALSEFHWVAAQPQVQTLAMAMCIDRWVDDRSCKDQCTTDGKADEPCTNECNRCNEAGKLRTEGERFIARLMEGRDPTMASRDLGTAVSSIIVGPKGEIPDASLELLACGGSLPAEVALLRPEFDKVVDRPITAAILAGLVRAPACWELTGKGYDSQFNPIAKLECGEDDGMGLARRCHGKSLERIHTILRLGEQVQVLEQVRAEFEVLQRAAANLEAARDRNTKGDERAREIFLTTLEVVDASLASADALLVAVAQFSDISTTFPAIDATAKPTVGVEKTREQIAELRALLSALRGFGTGEYTVAITASSMLMLEQLEQICDKSIAGSREKCRARVDIVGRHIGTITAILTAENVEDMAAALDAAANPPGGWRSKAMPGNLTVSLSAYPGFLVGGEMRWGQYGASLERGGTYFQAPTLAMPFGLDVAWGCKNCRKDWAGGLFFPLIDPAAFLLYDVDKGGKLPGPRPVTALSPGIAVRLGIPRTPLAILLSGTYRPQLRTWEATVSGPGANVFQFGLSVAVDVTLWKIFARGK